MLNYINRKKAQSTLEYAVLIIIIIGALLAIQVYIKRGIQGRMKQAADDIGDQFSPGNTSVNKITTVASETREISSQSGTTTNYIGNERTEERMNSQIIGQTTEFWGLQAP